jgi:hypothetical protein
MVRSFGSKRFRFRISPRWNGRRGETHGETGGADAFEAGH